MQKSSITTYCSAVCVVLCVVIVCAEITESAPTSADYESIRDLYELLLQKEAMEEIGQPQHLMVRKSNRSPQLRLRFGKKSDPYFAAQQHYTGHPVRLLEDMTEN